MPLAVSTHTIGCAGNPKNCHPGGAALKGGGSLLLYILL